MDIIGLISNALSAVSGFFGWQKMRHDDKNSPEIKANEQAKDRAKDADRINDTIAEAQSSDKKKSAAAQEKLRREFSEA